jgi:adenine-specific DNA-methyltransferase
MVQRRKLLASLTRARLAELASQFGISGLSGKSKDGVVQAIAAARTAKTAALLAALSRDELKGLCSTFGLDEGGRDKQSLIARLTGSLDGQPQSKARSPRRGVTEDVATQPAEVAKKGNPSMTTKSSDDGKRPIEQYEHADKTRVNNPPVGLVTPATDPDLPKKTYQYDPHLDPQLVWAGKAEHTCFEVPTVSLHVHERIDPRTIIRAVQKRNGNGGPKGLRQRSLFEEPNEQLPLREAIEFYKHAQGWTNRLIAGDSLVVMNSLLEKEGMAGKVQMIYVDPPYGIRYGSNFQPFVNQRDVKDGNDDDLTQEPEMIQAFRDTWELGTHSYLTSLRDRLLLARDLLHESGSCFVQISDQNVHHVREVMDETFGPSNFAGLITVRKTGGLGSSGLTAVADFLVWYYRDKSKVKYRKLFLEKVDSGVAEQYRYARLPDGKILSLKRGEDPPAGAVRFSPTSLHTMYAGVESCLYSFELSGKRFSLPPNRQWSTTLPNMMRLAWAGRIYTGGNTPRFIRHLDDFPVSEITTLWADMMGSDDKVYVVQTATRIVQRCLLMTTDPGDLVLDTTCGSGTTAYVAEQWGRRWITCDTSRVAITLAKQRLMTAIFDYYEMARPDEGVGSGFVYKNVPHVTLKSIANNPEIREGMTRTEADAAIAKYAEQETLYDQPKVDRSKVRVTGPFTVEAVPAPAVRPISEIVVESHPVDLEEQPALPGIGPLEEQSKLQFIENVSVARYGETFRQRQWRDELLACGIRAKGGQRIEFSRLEPLGGTRWLQCEGETKGPKPGKAVISFGPEHAPLEQRQVSMALDEAQQLRPTPTMIVFATFQFDPEAAKDIDETKWPGMTLLKVQMNTDLLTDDLKKARSSNESYWLMGQPDVELRQVKKGPHKGKYEVEIHGFDYYNPRTGAIESGDTTKIALWMLDTDYDGRSIYPRQVFFPMAGPKDGWARLAKNLKAEIDEDLIEAYRGTVSLPFAPGDYRRAAVKIVDDRGIESLKIVEMT